MFKQLNQPKHGNLILKASILVVVSIFIGYFIGHLTSTITTIKYIEPTIAFKVEQTNAENIKFFTDIVNGEEIKRHLK